MYRVYLIATPQHPRKEEWIDAVTVRESWSGKSWDFIDADGSVVHSLKQDRVNRFEQATDRRKPRPVKLMPQDLAWSERFGDIGIPA